MASNRWGHGPLGIAVPPLIFGREEGHAAHVPVEGGQFDILNSDGHILRT